jgi:hypothetical protein
MAEVFIAPLDSDLSQSDTWVPVGTVSEWVEHEPTVTAPLDLTDSGTLTGEVTGGTLTRPALEPPRKYRARYELPGRPPLYGTPAARTVDPATGQVEVTVELAPEDRRAELAEMWGDPVPVPEAPDAPSAKDAPALTPQRIADMFDIPLHLITPEETNP